MSTIDYESQGQKVQFSRQSVTVNGNEFAYIGITAIKHSSSKHIYLFKYDGEWQRLYYNEEDAPKLETLFTRISALNAKRAQDQAIADLNRSAKASLQGAKTADAPAGKVAKESNIKSSSIEEQVDLFSTNHSLDIKVALEKAIANDNKVGFEEPSESIPAEKSLDQTDTGPLSVLTSDSAPVAASLADASPDASSTSGSEPAAAVYSGESAVPDYKLKDTIGNDATASGEPVPAVDATAKKKRLKKALIIFAAFIAVFAVLATITIVKSGFASDSPTNPSTNESQQYKDIDGLIKDLKE